MKRKWGLGPGWLFSWSEGRPDARRLRVWSPVKACTRINRWMHNKWNNKSMFSLPLSPFSLSKINQSIKKFFKQSEVQPQPGETEQWEAAQFRCHSGRVPAEGVETRIPKGWRAGLLLQEPWAAFPSSSALRVIRVIPPPLTSPPSHPHPQPLPPHHWTACQRDCLPRLHLGALSTVHFQVGFQVVSGEWGKTGCGAVGWFSTGTRSSVLSL